MSVVAAAMEVVMILLVEVVAILVVEAIGSPIVGLKNEWDGEDDEDTNGFG